MIFCKCGVTLDISVEVIGIDGRHSGIIHMTDAMPYTVFFIYTHMAHLHRQKIFKGGLPYIIFIDVFADLKNSTLPFPISHQVHPRIFDCSKIKLQIIIPEKVSPALRTALQNGFEFAIGFNANQAGISSLPVVFVQFNDSYLLLQWMISHLRDLHHRIGHPSLYSMWSNEP